MNTLQPIDHTALRVNQIVIIGLNILAFVLNQPLLVVLVALAMLAGTLLGKPGFGLLYQRLLKPLGLAKPHVLLDYPQPHRFAQGLGGTFMLAAVLSLYLGAPLLGWSLAWMVAALAALNAFAGFCAGCMLYYWLGRVGLPGFIATPPDGVTPGLRPKTHVSQAGGEL